MAIRVLDNHTAELIAAGEVVERPSSVVKELCENAIDAGAKNVRVEIEKGGIASIQVQDDGNGVDAEDIPLAFLRHATSKIRAEEDLEHIVTLGFRGEALASIASVAQIELLTKTEADEFASLYSIQGGTEQGLQPAARAVGTTITVKNLFYNTPARMKFLKKDTSEGTFVTETVTRLALSHPEVAFHYVRDGKKVFATPGDGQVQSAAYAVLGADFARDLLAVGQQTGQYDVTGLVTRPTGARASRAMQFFFINGRFVKNRTMMAALEQAYRGTTMVGKFPGCVLFLQMPPQWVDINVHPAKTEVRFARESEVFDAVYAAVKGALAGNMHVHRQLDLSKNDSTAAPPVVSAVAPSISGMPNGRVSAVEEHAAAEPTTQRIRAYNKMVDTLASTSNFAPYELSETVAKQNTLQNDFTLFAEPKNDENTGIIQDNPVKQIDFTEEGAAEHIEIRYVGELFKTYILAEADRKLCLIDKHAAHERMLYEKLAAARGTPHSQQLLAPVNVTLSATEKNALLQNEAALQACGLVVEDFGGNNVLVRGVPADIGPNDVENLAVEIAERLSVNHRDTLDEKTEWVLHSVACRAAIKAGDSTHPQELLHLARDIISGVVPPFCPHGRPVVLEISQKDLEKQFGRLG